MEFYNLNSDLVQCVFVCLGIGFGSIVWAIIFCTGD